MVSSDALESAIGPTVRGLGYSLWGIERQRSPRGLLLRVFIDHPDGIDLSDCERVSRHVQDQIEAEGMLADDYRLEISSPGMDRQLFTLEQYLQFRGSPVQVRMRVPHRGRRNLQGVLRDINDRSVMLDCDGESVELPLGTIEKTRLVPQWPEKQIPHRGSSGRKHTG
ncbi:MAG: ribosome maturation factor RimP [Gammaproteobacteria bacterium]